MADQPPIAKVKISVTSEPFKDDPAGAEAYYTLLGRCVLLWARFESHLDFLLRGACNIKAAAPHRPDPIPISLKNKSKVLRRLVSTVPELRPVRDRLCSILTDASDAAQDRSVLVHGHCNGFIETEPLTARFIHHKPKGEALLIYCSDVTIENLRSLAATIDMLNTRLVPVSWEVLSLNPPTIGPKFQ